MKNYINYITENNDYKEQYDKDSLSYKLQTALHKHGNNSKEVNQLIGSFDAIDYRYEYHKATWDWPGESDQLTIIFNHDDNEEVNNLVGLESNSLSDYFYHIEANGGNEQIDLSEIEYTLNEDNSKIMKDVFKIFDIKYVYQEDESNIRYFFNIFDDYKDIEDVKDNLIFEIGQYVYECKVDKANNEYKKLNYNVIEAGDYGEKYFEFVFDLKKMKDFKGSSLYKYFELNDNIDWGVGGYDEVDYLKEQLDKNIKEQLEILLNIVKNKKEEVIKNIHIKYNISKIKSLGGDFIKYISSYEFQEKYIDNNVDNLKTLISEDVVDDKIMIDYGHLIEVENFNI